MSTAAAAGDKPDKHNEHSARYDREEDDSEPVKAHDGHSLTQIAVTRAVGSAKSGAPGLSL